MLAGHVVLQLGEITDTRTWKPLALVHMYVCVCMQGDRRAGNKAPQLPCYQESVRGTDPAESQEIPCGLCCHFPHCAEEREGLSEDSPRLTSDHILGEDLAQKTCQVQVSPPVFL